MQRSLLEQLHCTSHRGTLEFPEGRIPIWIVFHLQRCLSASFVYSSDNLELRLISCISNGHDSPSRSSTSLAWKVLPHSQTGAILVLPHCLLVPLL